MFLIVIYIRKRLCLVNIFFNEIGSSSAGKRFIVGVCYKAPWSQLTP